MDGSKMHSIMAMITGIVAGWHPAMTALAAIFLPFVSKFGYSSMFFLFACFTLVYFLVAALFLPETKGKTLEEIEAHFARS